MFVQGSHIRTNLAWLSGCTSWGAGCTISVSRWRIAGHFQIGSFVPDAKCFLLILSSYIPGVEVEDRVSGERNRNRLRAHLEQRGREDFWKDLLMVSRYTWLTWKEEMICAGRDTSRLPLNPQRIPGGVLLLTERLSYSLDLCHIGYFRGESCQKYWALLYGSWQDFH